MVGKYNLIDIGSGLVANFFALVLGLAGARQFGTCFFGIS